MIKPPSHGRSSAASYSACYYPRMNWTGGVAKWMYAKLLPSEWMNVGKVQNATAAPPINSWKLFPNAISHSPAFLFSIGQRNQHISISTTRISHGVICRATLHPSEYNRRWNLRDTLDALHCSRLYGGGMTKKEKFPCSVNFHSLFSFYCPPYNWLLFPQLIRLPFYKPVSMHKHQGRQNIVFATDGKATDRNKIKVIPTKMFNPLPPGNLCWIPIGSLQWSVSLVGLLNVTVAK